MIDTPVYSQIPKSYHIPTSDTYPIANSSMVPNYHALLTVPTSSFSTHLSQRSVLTNPMPNSIHESILKPVNEVYVAEDNQNSIVGVIDNSSTGQATIYAHSLVSATNNAQLTPCSSVLKVTPDQCTNIVHHPSVIPPTHATYLVSHDPNAHHHVIAASSTRSQAPTLFTIPLSQLSCDVSHAQVAVACTAQHPTVLTGVVATDTSITNPPTAFYPSYSLLQINQQRLTEDNHNCETNLKKSVHTMIETNNTTTTASSKTAVLAAAAAAGYLAQHLPSIANNNVHNASNNLNVQLKSVDVHESAIAAAASLPTVSVAAAAAAAAAVAIARSTSMNKNKVNVFI